MKKTEARIAGLEKPPGHKKVEMPLSNQKNDQQDRGICRLQVVVQPAVNLEEAGPGHRDMQLSVRRPTGFRWSVSLI